MQKSFRNFFVLSLLLVFFYNASGLSVCLDHAGHSKDLSVKVKDSKNGKEASFSQDDECQCALHLQMNHVLIPEPLSIDFPTRNSIASEIPHTKAITYRCLLDYFSSRAPPVLS